MPTLPPVLQQSLPLLIAFAGGSLLAKARAVPAEAGAFFEKLLYMKCRIRDDDDSFPVFMEWLAERTLERHSNSLRFMSTWPAQRPTNAPSVAGESRRATVVVHGTGSTFLNWRDARFLVTISEDMIQGKGYTITVTLRCLKKHRHLFHELAIDIDAFAARPDPLHTKILRPGWDKSWELHACRRTRPLDSVITADGMLQELLADMKQFIAQQDWYASLGIPYRRGYLFTGAPGNGKSTVAFALAGALGRDLYALPLGDAGMTDERLLGLMSGVPAGAIVLFEDIDTVFHQREKVADNKLTMSALLNTIDGPFATEGRLLVATTNHPEVLDAALMRPGRFDVQRVFANATAEQSRLLFGRMFPDTDAAMAGAFAAWAGDGVQSMAALQAHLLTHRNDPTAASRRG